MRSLECRNYLRAPSLVMTLTLGLLILTLGVLHKRAEGSPDSTKQETLIPVSTPNGATVWVEHADTTEKRVRGLMFRTNLPKDRGMLFTFAEPQHWTIWMKNTRIPLDIVWLDLHKRIVHIEANVPPCHRTDNGCPQYQPIRKAVFVIELAAGVADDLQLKKGTKLSFPVDPPSYLLK
jgi:uncharacterized protein